MLTLLHNLFYTLPILYIWAEVYHMINKKRLYNKVDLSNLNSKFKYDLIYYYTRVSYLIWIIVGLFSSLSSYFWIIILLSLLKYPILLRKSKYLEYYDIISQITSILILLLIMSKGLPF